ncbi:MAG: hypothetical protein K2W78_11480 [Xanthobacteraceae bacterium]|nr:hypothetical protein [Xanthobacteraceae bacterium]
MRAAVDLAKLMGVNGDIVVRSGDIRGFAVMEKVDACLHADDAQLDSEADEALAELDFSASYLFRRRYD